MYNNVPVIEKIAIISVKVDTFSLRKFIRNNNFEKLVIDSERQFKKKLISDKKLIKFDWNENHILTKLRVESLPLKVKFRLPSP